MLLDPDDDATILYTSGTTGKPKGAVGSHRNACSAIVARPYSQARTFLRRGEPVPAPDPNAPQKSYLLPIPLFHTTGCHAVMIPLIAGGGKLVFMHKWDPELALQIIERERITGTGGVPTIAWQLLAHPALEKYDLSSLESIGYGGAPAAAELVRRLKEKFPKSAPGFGCGMTETTSVFTGHSDEDYELRPESSGHALPVCGEDRGRRPRDATGGTASSWPRARTSRGYWRNPEATAATFSTAGCAPATSPGSTRKAFSSSSTGRRTC